MSALFDFIQSRQIVLNDEVRSIPFRVPAVVPDNGSMSTGPATPTQLQLELGLPLTEVSLKIGTVYSTICGVTVSERTLQKLE